MRALSLWRPWDYAILHLGKDVENRTWSPHPSMLREGDYFAVHGGLRLDDHAFRVPPIKAALHDGQLAGQTGGFGGIVRFDGVCILTKQGSLCDCSPWAMLGEVHWRLSDPRPFEGGPILGRGMQGLFWAPEEVAEAAAQLLAAA